MSGKGIFVGSDGLAFQITMGNNVLHLYPETSLVPGSPDPKNFLLVDPESCFDTLHGFKRITPDKKWILGREDPEQALFFCYSAKVSMRHLSLELKPDGIVFKDLATDTGSRIAPLKEASIRDRLLINRQGTVQKLREMFGRSLGILPPDEALSLLREVNEVLSKEAYRAPNKEGKPGALLELPSDKRPMILGDLHTNLDNLIKILTENNFLESLLKDEACLLIVGDAPHCEFDGREGEMDSSLLIMDFIFKLKLFLPNNFFYLRGNHDSFSPQIRKAGINQGALWKKKVSDTRGEDYLSAMKQFYRALPMVAVGRDFIACHAGPTKSPITREALVNLKEEDAAYNELLWNRVKSPRQPAGYVASTVKNFRQGLGFEEDVALIVGHTPPTQDDTLWLNVGAINNHHVLFDSRLEGVPVFTRVYDTLVPLMYHYEKLDDLLA